MTLNILHAEDKPADAELVQVLLESEGIAQTRMEFETSLEHRDFDLIISDYSMPSFSGRSALEITTVHMVTSD